MTDRKNVPGDDELPEPEAGVVPNRRDRRGHARKNGGVHVTPGRPHQADFVGRRVFRRTGG